MFKLLCDLFHKAKSINIKLDIISEDIQIMATKADLDNAIATLKADLSVLLAQQLPVEDFAPEVNDLTSMDADVKAAIVPKP